MQIERVRRKDIYQSVERETITYPTPEPFVLVVNKISTPYTERDFNGKECGSKIIHHFEPKSIFLHYTIVGREKDFYRG
jgi:hypothetical protein